MFILVIGNQVEAVLGDSGERGSGRREGVGKDKSEERGGGGGGGGGRGK